MAFETQTASLVTFFLLASRLFQVSLKRQKRTIVLRVQQGAGAKKVFYILWRGHLLVPLPSLFQEFRSQYFSFVHQYLNAWNRLFLSQAPCRSNLWNFVFRGRAQTLSQTRFNGCGFFLHCFRNQSAYE